MSSYIPKKEKPKLARRTSKSGKVYYYDESKYKKKSRPSLRDTRPLQQSKTDEYYLRYFERKMEIRSEYPTWNEMSSDQWRNYFQRIYELTMIDEDYKHWMWVINQTDQDKLKEEKWERAEEKRKNYNGSTDEYY
jgi:hypothetical protein